MKRNSIVAAVAALLVSVAVALSMAARPALAATWGNIFLANSVELCVNDPNNAPSQHNGQNLAVCNYTNPAQGFTAVPSSYGSGWYSVENENTSGGTYCLSQNGSSNGNALELYGCNGTSEQAWRFVKVQNPLGTTSTEIENANAFSVNDYGGHEMAGDRVAQWPYEDPAPWSLLWGGPPPVN